jgi:acyl-coenzyme A thioesterase PaaI-like protein
LLEDGAGGAMMYNGSMDATRLAARLLEPVPANRTFGVRVLSAAGAAAEVELVAAAAFENVIGSLHSSGLVALIDATGLAAMIAAASDESQFEGLTPLGSETHVEFLAPARGRLVGRYALTPESVSALGGVLERRERKAEVTTAVEVCDQSGTVVCRGSFIWKLRRSL